MIKQQVHHSCSYGSKPILEPPRQLPGHVPGLAYAPGCTRQSAHPSSAHTGLCSHLGCVTVSSSSSVRSGSQSTLVNSSSPDKTHLKTLRFKETRIGRPGQAPPTVCPEQHAAVRVGRDLSRSPPCPSLLPHAGRPQQQVAARI